VQLSAGPKPGKMGRVARIVLARHWWKNAFAHETHDQPANNGPKSPAALRWAGGAKNPWALTDQSDKRTTKQYKN